MAKKTTPAKAKAKAKSVAKAKGKAAKAKVIQAAPTGMWKILEQKKAHLKEMEQARSEGRTGSQGHGHSFHANPRDHRFSKFAGPRRKAG